MTEPSPSNALKHGAFSEVHILPGEDPFRFPLRKKAKTSFCSSLVTSLPSIIWTKSWK